MAYPNPAANTTPAPAVRHLRPVDRPVDDDAAAAWMAAEVDRARTELPTVDPAVFDCYLGRLALTVEPTSEADPLAVLASLICATGVMVGPRPHVQAGDDRHPLLVWPLVIGRTSAGRKGASWGTAKRLVNAADPTFTATNVRSGLTSGEGLAAVFAERNPGTDGEPSRQARPDASHPAEPDGSAAAGRDATPSSPAGESSPPLPWLTGNVTEPTRTDASPPAAVTEPAGGKRHAGQPSRPPAGATGRGGLPVRDRRLLVFEPEWSAVMARMRREGNSLSATLRAAWEGGDLSTMNVTARNAPDSHVGILAHITPEEFRTKVQAADLAGGTYNRFLPIMVARSKFLPLSTGADPQLIAELGAALAARLRTAAGVGLLGFTGPGAALWRRLYVEFSTDPADAGPVEQFTSRAAPHCLRIAAIHAITDRATAIDTHHLTAAAALVRYATASAQAVFTNPTTGTRLLAWITNAGPDGRTRKQITTDYFGGNRRSADIDTILAPLITAGRVTVTKQPPASGRGRAIEVYTVTDAGQHGDAHPP